MRIALGVIVGFLVWSIVWVGGDQSLRGLWGDYAIHMMAAERALVNNEPFAGNTAIEIANLIRSFITTLIAGYMAALVAGEYSRTTMILGIILIAVGIAVQFMMWNLAPAWYHIVFVLMLLPMTVAGGRLRRSV
jgi:hypothetical protein